MFRHQMCHPQGACLHYLAKLHITIAAIVRINKTFKTLKLSSVIEWLLLHAVCMVAVYTVCNKYDIY